MQTHTHTHEASGSRTNTFGGRRAGLCFSAKRRCYCVPNGA